MVASFGLQATALARGRLSVVQPILTLELPILVLILVFWFGQRLGWHEVVGSTAAAGGLAAFLTFANPQGGDEVPNVRTWGIAATAGIAAITISVGLARQGRPAWRAAWYGSAAAISYAFTAAFAKEVTEQIGVKWYSPFLSWQIWGMAVAGLLGIFLTQNAFHAGPVTASQSTLVIVDPLVSLLIGIGLFGDNLQTSGARGPLESLSSDRAVRWRLLPRKVAARRDRQVRGRRVRPSSRNAPPLDGRTSRSAGRSGAGSGATRTGGDWPAATGSRVSDRQRAQTKQEPSNTVDPLAEPDRADAVTPLRPVGAILDRIKDAASLTSVDPAAVAMMSNPERILQVAVPVRMDDGRVEVFTGWRAHHSTIRGPAKGGIRFHPTVTAEEVIGPRRRDDPQVRGRRPPVRWWQGRGGVRPADAFRRASSKG